MNTSHGWILGPLILLALLGALNLWAWHTWDRDRRLDATGAHATGLVTQRYVEVEDDNLDEPPRHTVWYHVVYAFWPANPAGVAPPAKPEVTVEREPGHRSSKHVSYRQTLAGVDAGTAITLDEELDDYDAWHRPELAIARPVEIRFDPADPSDAKLAVRAPETNMLVGVLGTDVLIALMTIYALIAGRKRS